MRKPPPNYTGQSVAPPAPTELTPEEMCAEGVFTVKAAAVFLGICQSSVKRMLPTKELVSFMFRGRRVIPKRACVRILAEALQKST